LQLWRSIGSESRKGLDRCVAHDEGFTTAANASVVDGGSMVYVAPPKMVVIPLGASVMTGPRDVTMVKVDPSTAVNTEEYMRMSSKEK
jgi:hypothetical protein